MTTAHPPRVTPSNAPPLYARFGFQVLAALVLGIGLGLLATAIGPNGDGAPNGLTATLQALGTSYVTLLTATVAPLIVTAVVSSISRLRSVTNAARLAGKTLLWFAITALIAVLIGIALGAILRPGSVASHALQPGTKQTTATWWNFLTGLIPSNILGLQGGTNGVSVNVLQIIVISFAIGIAALKVGEKAAPFIEFTESARRIIMRVLRWIIRIAPLGTLGLIGNAVALYGWGKIGSLGLFTLTIYIGLALVLFGVYPLLLLVHRLSVRQFFSGAWPAIQLAFVSRSSLGTLPVTERVAERYLGVPREYASFAVPFGSTTKMDGCAAIYPAIAALFVAQFFGIALNPIHFVLIVVVAVLGSAATAGTTGATVMLTLTLSTLGLPLAGVGLLLAIDPILDMGRTAVNVAGQALIPTLVAKREGILDLDRYHAPRRGDVFQDDADEPADGMDPAPATA